MTAQRDDGKWGRHIMRLKWVFNPYMIWGAVLGFLIFSGIGQIQNAWWHKGPGPVTYEEPYRTEVVSEAQYKRHEYTMGGMMLVIGLSLWIAVAKDAKGDDKKSHPENPGV